MKQEYPLNEEDAFLHSGKGLFQDELEKGNFRVIDSVEEEDNMSIYKEPEDGEEYCIGADCSMGHKDGDAQCFYVMNSKTWEVAARWHGRIAPDLYAEQIIKWGDYYNEAFVGIEENNCGLAVITTVKQDYTNLYQRERRDKVTDEITHQLGWYTSDKTKDEIIASVKKALREGDVPGIPIELREELKTFVQKENGKREALEGCHDDEVMAFGITIMMIKHNPYYEIKTSHSKFMGRETYYSR